MKLVQKVYELHGPAARLKAPPDLRRLIRSTLLAAELLPWPIRILKRRLHDNRAMAYAAVVKS